MGMGEDLFALWRWWGAVTVPEEERAVLRAGLQEGCSVCLGPDLCLGPGWWSRPGMLRPKLSQWACGWDGRRLQREGVVNRLDNHQEVARSGGGGKGALGRTPGLPAQHPGWLRRKTRTAET